MTALQPVRLRTLAREPFLVAVTGNQLSADALRKLITARAPRETAVADGVLEPSAAGADGDSGDRSYLR